jgi:hypothetical protein
MTAIAIHFGAAILVCLDAHPRGASAHPACQGLSVGADCGWNQLLSGECRLVHLSLSAATRFRQIAAL